GTIDQRRAQPFLQGADAAAEGGLGAVAVFRGAGEIAGGGEGEEVLEPGEVEGHAQAAVSSARPAGACTRVTITWSMRELSTSITSKRKPFQAKASVRRGTRRSITIRKPARVSYCPRRGRSAGS